MPVMFQLICMVSSADVTSSSKYSRSFLLLSAGEAAALQKKRKLVNIHQSSSQLKVHQDSPTVRIPPKISDFTTTGLVNHSLATEVICEFRMMIFSYGSMDPYLKTLTVTTSLVPSPSLPSFTGNTVSSNNTSLLHFSCFGFSSRQQKAFDCFLSNHSLHSSFSSVGSEIEEQQKQVKPSGKAVKDMLTSEAMSVMSEYQA